MWAEISWGKKIKWCWEDFFLHPFLAETFQNLSGVWPLGSVLLSCPSSHSCFHSSHWICKIFRSSMSFNLLCFVLLAFGCSYYRASDTVSVGWKNGNYIIFKSEAMFVFKEYALNHVLCERFTLFCIKVFI